MVKESSNTKKIVILVLFILVLCLLGLATLSKSYATTKDVEPQFNGCEACSASVTQVSYGSTIVAPVTGPHGVNVYLIPNGDSYTVAWQAYADVLGLAPWNTGSQTFTAGTDCHINTPTITVCSTVQVV